MSNPMFEIESNPHSHIRHVVAVMSGKGGVGKSLVTSLLASTMRKAGYNVGILDADITGPSIPKMYHVAGPVVATEEGSYPKKAEDGTYIMSLNLLVDEEQPVIWRGPVIGGTVKQFWTDVMWGDLDYLFIDMPPGTGDVPLTVFQSLPIDGVIVVTSPQDLVSLIVKKAMKMAKLMKISVLGIVENYSFMKCPHCEEILHIFGESHIDEIASAAGSRVIAKLPVNPQFAALADQGRAYEIDLVLDEARSLLESLPEHKEEGSEG